MVEHWVVDNNEQESTAKIPLIPDDKPIVGNSILISSDKAKPLLYVCMCVCCDHAVAPWHTWGHYVRHSLVLGSYVYIWSQWHAPNYIRVYIYICWYVRLYVFATDGPVRRSNRAYDIVIISMSHEFSCTVSTDCRQATATTTKPNLHSECLTLSTGMAKLTSMTLMANMDFTFSID